MRNLLKDEHGVRAACFLVGHRQSEFKGHIKPGSPRSGPTHLNAREVMDGITATAELIENLVQPPATAGNLKRGAWQQAESADTRYVGKKQRLEFCIVGRSEEHTSEL